MTEEISRNTVMVLVVVALFVSVLSTLLVLSMVNTYELPAAEQIEQTPSGIVKFSVKSNVEATVGDVEPSTSSGTVKLEVKG